MAVALLSSINFILLLLFADFAYESYREQEPRAPKFGYAGFVLHVVLAAGILFIPSIHPYVAIYVGILFIAAIVMLLPFQAKSTSQQGTESLVVGAVNRFDERDQVFARNETLHPDREEYHLYYEAHPDLKGRDDQRRALGGDLGEPGSIDQGHPANVSMLFSAFEMGRILEPNAVNVPEQTGDSVPMDPAQATAIVKGFARQLGADLVGICKVDPRWIYSHRGEIHMDNWQDWGQEIPTDLPYAVVIATEMDHKMVITSTSGAKSSSLSGAKIIALQLPGFKVGRTS
jgi:hypothetical protein